MNVVVAAPQANLAVYVRTCNAALGVGPHDVVAFAHDHSRDPTIELPDLVFRVRPRLVVLIAPSRLDPATIDAMRRFGAMVIAWFEPLGARDGRAAAARRTWIARACDAVVATDAGAAVGLVDRGGRGASLAGGQGLASVVRACVG